VPTTRASGNRGILRRPPGTQPLFANHVFLILWACFLFGLALWNKAATAIGYSFASALFGLLCSGMACMDAVRLGHQLTQAQDAFEKAQRQLEKRAGILSRREYLALSNTVELAWALVQNRRNALDQHVQQHSCKTARA
jgi:hypothetical protein